jgi:hypothetical protein
MRLIITGLWGQLEPATSEEIEALEQSAAKGNWTIGRGPTEALAARLGPPSGGPRSGRPRPARRSG